MRAKYGRLVRFSVLFDSLDFGERLFYDCGRSSRRRRRNRHSPICRMVANEMADAGLPAGVVNAVPAMNMEINEPWENIWLP